MTRSDPGASEGKPMLLLFGDESVEACCTVAYLRWELADRFVVCHLLAGKTRVALKCKISIPQMELMGALAAVRLHQEIQDSLNLDIRKVRFFTDSSAGWGMIFRDSGSFLECLGTRVSKIRAKSKVEIEWFWIPGELNPVDMGTRPTVTPKGYGSGHALPEGSTLDVPADLRLTSQEGIHTPSS
jgi:hypothetical protein